MVNGNLYISSPNNAFAIDARTGKEIWHYFWRTQGGLTIGNRGVGMWGNYVFFDTPDQHLVSLDAATGKERWNMQKTDSHQENYASTAPTVIGNHVLTAAGGDFWTPGWRNRATRRPGASMEVVCDAARGRAEASRPGPASLLQRAAAAPWQPPTYDPELNLIYVGTGNPQPVMIGQPSWRQLVDVLNRGIEPGYRQDGLVLPGVAARHA